MSTLLPKTCVTPQGVFRHAVHKPSYSVLNHRINDSIQPLGTFENDASHDNTKNFPKSSVDVQKADWIYEIFNPFPFRGATYICKSWADPKASAPASICLPAPPKVSLSDVLQSWFPEGEANDPLKLFKQLPRPLLLSLAANSTDPKDLITLATYCCQFQYDQDNDPVGLQYFTDKQGKTRARIDDSSLFEVVVNNYFLPDIYKEIMVLRPGVQGGSEIIGEWQKEDSHIFEYLRSNSYIPWGHYAANMANDSIRYHFKDISKTDFAGLRHLYYQRTYTRLADLLHITLPRTRECLSIEELEDIRSKIIDKINKGTTHLPLTSTLWGWNYGFDCASSGYRLHASHQMIHQQFALLPESAEYYYGAKHVPSEQLSDHYTPYGCGDHISDFIADYKRQSASCFFTDYINAIYNNQRMDGRTDLESSLVVYEDNHVMLFVPKAQTSQWELQLMTKSSVGNIIEADTAVRQSMDKAMLTAMKVLTTLGAKMISTIEFPKRFQAKDATQRLLYSFLPKLPESPGAFSEAQLRWINGHYPEDFARACRMQL